MDQSMYGELVQVGTLVLSDYWSETLQISAESSPIVYFSISALIATKCRGWYYGFQNPVQVNARIRHRSNSSRKGPFRSSPPSPTTSRDRYWSELWPELTWNDWSGHICQSVLRPAKSEWRLRLRLDPLIEHQFGFLNGEYFPSPHSSPGFDSDWVAQRSESSTLL